MGEVVDFTVRRLAKHTAKPKVTMDSIVAESTDFLLGEWEKMARHNRLNDYFKRTLPSLIEHGNKTNFMADLTAVSNLELNIELFPIMWSPGTQSGKQMGWVVQFKIESHMVSTPELASEAYARCFAILLFLKIKRSMIENGLINGTEIA